MAVRPPGPVGVPPVALGSIETILRRLSRRLTLSGSDPYYNAETDTYRQVFHGHDNASAVTNHEGLTVFFDPDTHEVLGFSIANFSEYYKRHVTEDGDFEVSLPARVPAPLEEEMDFDEEQIRTGVRIAEMY